MPKEECAFCPSQATATGEHLWSDWINGILSDRIYQFKKVDAKKLTVKNWEASELNLKSRVVCGQCNSGWMSQLDGSEAKPILRHLIVDLGPRQLPIRWLISLALFGFKTAVISDHVSIRNAPFFSREQRHNFARTLQIPGGVYMWFGALSTTGKESSQAGMSYLPSPAKITFVFILSPTLLAILFFRLLELNGPAMMRKGFLFPTLSSPRRMPS